MCCGTSMWTSVIVSGIFIQLIIFARAEIVKKVTGSGSLKSDHLDPGETYRFEFDGYPNKNALLLFNFTEMRGLMPGDFKIYGDPIASDTKCSVFKRSVESANDKNLCHNLWKNRYSGCVLNQVSSDRCTVTFKRQGTSQELSVDYNVIDCNTGDMIKEEPPHKITDTEIVTTVGEPTQTTDVGTITEIPPSVDGHTQTTDVGKVPPTTADTTIFEDPVKYGLSFILPIAFSVLVVITVIVIACYMCCSSRRRKPKDSAGMVEEVDEIPVYEEIPELPIRDNVHREGPYHTLTRDGTKETIQMDEIPYNTLERRSNKNGEIPVVRLMVTDNDEKRF